MSSAKRVVREEPFGNAPAIKVIYSDGSWGLRALNSSSRAPSRGSSAPKDRHVENLDYLTKEGMFERGYTVHQDEAEALRKYTERFKRERGRETTPEDIHFLGETMEGQDPGQHEKLYTEYLSILQDDDRLKRSRREKKAADDKKSYLQSLQEKSRK